jgi:hypothetical protein
MYVPLVTKGLKHFFFPLSVLSSLSLSLSLSLSQWLASGSLLYRHSTFAEGSVDMLFWGKLIFYGLVLELIFGMCL